jgi:hypothetical protein
MVHDAFGSREHGDDESLPERTRRQRRKEENEKEFRGLCVNCANRSICLFPKSEGGVWHCEEYVEEH